MDHSPFDRSPANGSNSEPTATQNDQLSSEETISPTDSSLDAHPVKKNADEPTESHQTQCTLAKKLRRTEKALNEAASKETLFEEENSPANSQAEKAKENQAPETGQPAMQESERLKDTQVSHQDSSLENTTDNLEAEERTDEKTAEKTDETTDEKTKKDGSNPYLPVPVEEESEEKEEDLSDLEKKRQQANKVILTFTATAAATGALPVPLADAPLLIAQQIAMIAQISDIYHINLKKSGLKSLVFTILGVSGTTVLGKTITGSLFKLLPGIGSIGGAAISGTTAAALTAALGAAYNEVCEKVFSGELDESRLLEYEGRQLLETSFKNHLRLEMDAARQKEKEEQDVLKQTPVPEDDEPILLHHQADAEPAPKNEETANTEAE